MYKKDGREQLVMTLRRQPYQTHSTILVHGLVTWLTQGVHLGYWRNWFSLHVDDVFLPDARWSTAEQLHRRRRLPGRRHRRRRSGWSPADVDSSPPGRRRPASSWTWPSTAAAACEPVRTTRSPTKFVADRADFRWLNHTYGHPYLGCVQDFTVVPWQCATDRRQCTAVDQPARDHRARSPTTSPGPGPRASTLDTTELVTGEHSGLKSLPQMPADNPNLAPALTAAGIRTIASDALPRAVRRA